MKVNTDGVLLGAVVPVCDADCRVLDIGTGTGVIALMLAQRLTADTEQSSRMRPLRILGIDIDPDAAVEAADNFASSEWAEALTSEESSLESLEVRLAGTASEAFDIIVSNPPYYDSSLTNPDGKGCGEAYGFASGFALVSGGDGVRCTPSVRNGATFCGSAVGPGVCCAPVCENVRAAFESSSAGADCGEKATQALYRHVCHSALRVQDSDAYNNGKREIYR